MVKKVPQPNMAAELPLTVKKSVGEILTLLESVYSSTGINQLLLTGKERMAV